MPSLSKKRKPIPATIIHPNNEPQDYVDPLQKLALNPGQTIAEKVIDAANKATGKVAIQRPRAKVSKLVPKLAAQPKLSYDPSARMNSAELEQFYAADERKAEANRFVELTTVPDITLSATGAIQPGTGPILSSMVRSGYKGLNSTLGLTGQVLQDAFGSDDMPTVLGDLGKALSNLSKESAPTFENYDLVNPPQQGSISERTAGFLVELGIQLPPMMLATQLLGTAGGFGALKVEHARANGERDPGALAGAFVQGAAEGALLHALGKTASIIEGSKGTNVVSKLLKKSPIGAQAAAQGLGGGAQVGVDSLLHSNSITPDWLDYLHGGVANVIMDPVVLGGSGKSRKATQAATATAKERDPSSYNLELPPDNLVNLRQDFWQPKDLPWDNRVTVGLLNKSRVQFVDSPGDPEGVLYVNPQAGLVIDRASEAVMPGNKLISGVVQGMALNAKAAQRIANHLLEKAAQFKATIKQLPDGDPKLNDLATGAVVFESLAEHLQAASANGRSISLRMFQKKAATQAANPIAREFDQSILGHESTHLQTQKIAQGLKIDPRTLTAPGWLADHPIGAKVILGIGDSKSPLQSYDPSDWTSEAIAHAAQPGADPGLGLSKQERGVLVGDYFAEVMDRHGPEVMNQVWVGIRS